MNNYNDYMRMSKIKDDIYESWDKEANTKKPRFEVDDTIGIFKTDDERNDHIKTLSKPKAPLMSKDTSELTKAFFLKRNDEQQEKRDNVKMQTMSPRQYKNSI